MNMQSNPPTIMIVDDEPENLNLLGEMLRGSGMGVRALPSGALALAAARDELPDMVLLDIQMPGMDGYEVCRRFKEDDRLRQVPIIFLSAFAETTDKLRAFESGGVDYVTKPFVEVEVLARIRIHLQQHWNQVQLEILVQQRVWELAEALRRLRIWDEAKSQWLGVLSHEMGTPLNGVFGITDLLFMDLPADSEHHDLREDFDSSRARIEKLMNDALTLARIDVANEGFALASVPLMGGLQNALDEVARQHPVPRININLADVGLVCVLAESELLSRALSDLLLTATHCVTADETITLEVRVADEQAHVRIVTDGKSLPADALETFFEVGGQRVLLKGGGDFGLGPVLASRIIHLFNGRVTVRNASPHGLIMEIALPVETLSSCQTTPPD